MGRGAAMLMVFLAHFADAFYGSHPLFHGGLALLMFWMVLLAEETSAGRAFNHWAAIFGRCSLVCFIAQFYVYCTAVCVLPKPPEWVAPPYFLFTVGLLRLLVVFWERRGLNRLITVGVPRLAASWRGSPVAVLFGLVPGTVAGRARAGVRVCRGRFASQKGRRGMTVRNNMALR
jgi:hypothetical protein